MVKTQSQTEEDNVLSVAKRFLEQSMLLITVRMIFVFIKKSTERVRKFGQV